MSDKKTEIFKNGDRIILTYRTYEQPQWKEKTKSGIFLRLINHHLKSRLRRNPQLALVKLDENKNAGTVLLSGLKTAISEQAE